MAFYTAYNILADARAGQQQAQGRDLHQHRATTSIRSPRAAPAATASRAGASRIRLRFLTEKQEENPYFALQPRHRRHRSAQADARADAVRESRERVALHDRSARPRRRRRRWDRSLDQSEWRTYIQKTTSSCAIWRKRPADSPIVNTNDFVGELKRVDAETSDYYVLGFYSSNPDPMKRTRRLEVKVDRPNVNVTSRTEYSLKTPGKPPAPPPLKPKK